MGGAQGVVAGSEHELLRATKTAAYISVFTEQEACAIDGAVSAEHLERLRNFQSHHLAAVAALHPNACNKTDEKGETLLHKAARAIQTEVLSSWLEAPGAAYCPIASKDGETALHLAISNRAEVPTMVLLTSLTPQLNTLQSESLTSALRLLAERTPHKMLAALQAIEPKVIQVQAEFRAEVDATAVDGSDEFIAPTAMWSDFKSMDGHEAEGCVIVLPDWIGDPSRSPFQAIVEHCDAQVYDSMLMALTVEYKWQINAWPKLRRTIAIEVLLTLLRCVAMVASSVALQPLPWGEAKADATAGLTATDGLVALAVLAQLYKLGLELREMCMLSVQKYLGSAWNHIDLLSGVSILAGSAGHFAGEVAVVRSAGSIGSLLLWVGLFHHFSAFSSTGPLVRMIQQILIDMGPFMLVLASGIAGFGFFFLARSPLELGYDNELVGPVWPFVSVFLLALGDFDPSQYTDVLSLCVLLLALLFSTVLLLNLLIAILSDSYEQVKLSEIVEACKGRARLIVEHELLSPTQNTYPRYMHLLRVAGSGGGASQPWEGVAGQMKQVEARLVAKHEELAKQNAELKDKLSKMEEELKRALAAQQMQLMEALKSTAPSPQRSTARVAGKGPAYELRVDA